MKKILIIPILFLLLSIFPIVFGQPSSKPDWAVEGASLNYGWGLWEYCPFNELEEKIELLKYSADPSYWMDLVDVDSERGVFSISTPNDEGTGSWEYNWEDTAWNVSLGLPIYYPASKLQGAPLVDLDTALGTFKAYEVQEERQFGGGNVRNETYWFEQSTGVLLLVVSTQGDTVIDLIVMPLLNTDIWVPSREFNVVVEEDTYDVVTSSNSTITSFYFHPTEHYIFFNVYGPSGTTGFCNISIPAELLWGEFSIYKDGVKLVKNVDYTETSNETYYDFHITYSHSTHGIQFVSTETIPEFPSWIMLPLFMTASFAVIIYRNRLGRKIC